MSLQLSSQFSTCPLFRHHPELFETFVGTYCEILQVAVEEAVSGTDRHVFSKVRTLAKLAGEKNAEPQDLIAVHLSALAILVNTKPQAMVRACIRHSRLLLVKLVGELALYYREQAVRSKAISES
jgi:hypothetical protein